MTWTPGRERVWKVFVAVWVASMVAFLVLAIVAPQTVLTDAEVMFGSVPVVCTFCLGVKRMALLLAGFGALMALSLLVLRPLHLGWVPLLIATGSWSWITVRRRQRATH